MSDPNTLEATGIGAFTVSNIAHEQISQHLKIPKGYYDRARMEQPDLYVRTVNTWIESADSPRTLRTLDNTARAILSDRFRPLDDYPLLRAVLPTLSKMNGTVLSANISDEKMYLKIVFAELEARIPNPQFPDDRVQFGLCIHNSEVGRGRLAIDGFMNRLVCKNGMRLDSVLSKYHVGRSKIDLSDAVDLWSDGTKEQSDKAFWMQVEDTIRGAMTMDKVNEYVEAMGVSTGRMMEKPQETVKLLCDNFNLSGDQHDGIMKHLISGGDLSQWGLINAVTRTAEDQDSYDIASELEKLGGDLVTANKSTLARLLIAA